MIMDCDVLRELNYNNRAVVPAQDHITSKWNESSFCYPEGSINQHQILYLILLSSDYILNLNVPTGHCLNYHNVNILHRKIHNDIFHKMVGTNQL